MTMQVLVADDDASIRRMLLTILRRDDYEVLEVESGLAAWELLQQQPIPLLVVDWMMPLMTGVDLVRHIRAASFPHYTYV
ncbi:MAG: response regulator, partial [Ardenticatenales bacterium]|nr:response regulator [Ardenticatenales bacterium]